MKRHQSRQRSVRIGSPLRPDDRGATTVVSHVLAIGITSLLVLLLLGAAGSYLGDQRELVAREELQTIGHRMANELSQLERLSAKGGNATVISDHPEEIAGSSYNVRIGRGGTCETGSFDTDACLVLWSNDLDVTQKVPLRTSSATTLEITEIDPGSYRFEATGSLSSEVRDPGTVDLSMTVGVGRDVDPDSTGPATDTANNPPLAKFTFNPGSPDSSDNITFNATESEDVDGTIVTYRWNFSSASPGGTTVTTANPTVTHNYSSVPGRYNVTLNITDDNGDSNLETRTISVSGLEYRDDMDVGGSSDEITFTLRNEWPSSVSPNIVITDILIDPQNNNVEEIDNGAGREVEIDVNDDGTTEDFYNSGGETVIEEGVIFGGFSTDVSSGDNVRITVSGFEDVVGNSFDMGGEEVEVAIRYQFSPGSVATGDVPQTNTTRFSDVPGGPAISNYGFVTAGGNLHLEFESDEELSAIDVDLQGDLDGTSDDPLTETDFSESTSGSNYVYNATVLSPTSDGTYVAQLQNAENTSGVPAGGTPYTDSETIATGYSWSTAAEWDQAVDQQGITHASYGTHQPDRLEMGYPTFDPDGSSLLTYYPLEETGGTTANDLSGNGFDADHVNNPNLGAGGVFGNAYEFDGNGDRLLDDDADVYLNGQDAVTISVWVQDDDSSGDNRGIINGEGPGDGDDDTIALRNDAFGADGGCSDCYKAGVTSSNDGERNIESSSNTQTSNWRHLVFTWDGASGDLDLYTDGTPDSLSSTESGTGTIEDVQRLLVGSGPKDSSSSSWDGRIDEVRIYDRELTGPEAQDLADAETEGTLTTEWQSGSSISPQNLRIDYDLDIASSETVEVRVQADNDNDGTPDGSSDWVTFDSSDSGSGSYELYNPPRDDRGSLAGISSDRYRIQVRLTRPSLGDDGPEVNSLELSS